MYFPYSRERDMFFAQLWRPRFRESFWNTFPWTLVSPCPGFCTRIYRAHRTLRACANACLRTLGRTLTHLHAFASPTEHRECGDYATSHDTVDGYIMSEESCYSRVRKSLGLLARNMWFVALSRFVSHIYSPIARHGHKSAWKDFDRLRPVRMKNAFALTAAWKLQTKEKISLNDWSSTNIWSNFLNIYRGMFLFYLMHAMQSARKLQYWHTSQLVAFKQSMKKNR